LVGSVRNDQDQIIIIPEGLLLGFNYDAAINPALFLQQGVRVVPVCTLLYEWKLISEGLARQNWRRSKIGHATLKIE